MKKENLPEGIEIGMPNDFQLAAVLPATPSSRSARKFPASGAISMPEDTANSFSDDWILPSLDRAGLKLVRQVAFLPPVGPNAIVTRTRPEESTIAIAVNLSNTEGAVILFEQDGLYVWKHPQETAPTASVRKKGTLIESTQKTAHFVIGLGDALPAGSPAIRGNIFGTIKEFAFGKVKAYILKFLASRTVELAGKQLEKNVVTGVISIKSDDPLEWKSIPDIQSLDLPKDRSAKILFLVHGTFSSTVGAYGVLGATPWGKSLLRSAFQYYDAIIGFDHVTLGQNPLQNAQQFLDHFGTRSWAFAPVFDIVAHSRGGLVVRSLIEKLLPASSWKPVFHRVVFVACTNEGTLLAEPDNWNNLINLYTNLTAGACRAISIIAPQTKIAMMLFSGIIENLGSFVKYCAEAAITDQELPGLAAMEPLGGFIRDINDVQEGQPTLADSYYCAITSEFKPLLTGDQQPKELPKRLLEMLAGGFMGQLMQMPNDLVVNTASMDGIDRSTGNFIKERYEFGENSQVYHTNYFTRPEVTNALARWFSLPAATPPEIAVHVKKPLGGSPGRLNSGGKPAGTLGARPSVKGNKKFRDPALTPTTVDHWDLPFLAGNMPGSLISPTIDTNIISIDADQPAHALVKMIAAKSPSFVVVQRPHQGHILNYAFKGEEALDLLKGQTNQPLIQALNLHESQASGFQQFAIGMKPHAPAATRGFGFVDMTPQRNVVLSGKVPIGVVPEKSELADIARLAAAAKVIASPASEKDRMLIRRTMPSFTQTSTKTKSEKIADGDQNGDMTSRPADQSPDPSSTVLCHFHAEMDAEVQVKHATTMIITISREALEKAISPTSVGGQGTVAKDEKLLIRVIAKSNFVVDDTNDGRAEIEVPQPGQPQELFIDCRATAAGEGELWILVRQGAVSILKLVLKPRAVLIKSLTAEKVRTEQDADQPKRLKRPLNQLWIEEAIDSHGIYYKFNIYSEGVGERGRFQSEPMPIEGSDRTKYVAGLYARIENRWISSQKDVANFAEELRAEGAVLFDELIPKDLKRILWDHRAEFDSIQVISSEPFIPWELVHLREPGKNGMPDETIHLGQMGLIRWLDGAGKNGWPPDALHVRQGQVRYVVPRYPHPDYSLPAALLEEKFLKDEFGAVAVTPESGEVRKLLSKPGLFDILHFACHGNAQPGSIAEASLLMEGRQENSIYFTDSLSATTVAKFCNLGGSAAAPMIILNACQTGCAGYKLTGIGGFANAFLAGGACAFTGALWSIGDHPAFTFTKTLYHMLRAGKDLSTAAKEAREAARTAGDATWLAYVVYGHPHLELTFG